MSERISKSEYDKMQAKIKDKKAMFHKLESLYKRLQSIKTDTDTWVNLYRDYRVSTAPNHWLSGNFEIDAKISIENIKRIDYVDSNGCDTAIPLDKTAGQSKSIIDALRQVKKELKAYQSKIDLMRARVGERTVIDDHGYADFHEAHPECTEQMYNAMYQYISDGMPA